MLRTTPASASTRRCLLTACRVMRVPAVSRAIDCGRPRLSRASTPRRVASPSAANTEARAFSPLGCRRLDMARDVLHLDGPAFAVPQERLVAAMARDFVEPGLDHAKPGAAHDRLERELDQRRRLPGVIRVRVER